jgi:hypothetical protein
MKPLTLLTRTAAFAGGILGTLLVLELGLRLLPVIDGAFAADPRPSWPIHTLIPDSHYTHSSGWNFQNRHHGRINNYGYVSPFDYHPASGGVAVFGDSYIEGLMNDYHDTLQGALGELLHAPRKVMNFGMSGADLPHYLGTAELVAHEFKPDWAVFLITQGDFTGGFSAQPGYYVWNRKREPPIELRPELNRSELMKFGRSLALVRYLRGNLSMQPSRMLQWRRGVDKSPPCKSAPPPSRQDEALMSSFLDELPRQLALPPERIVLVFDADRKAIYDGKSEAEALRCASPAMLANVHLEEQARLRGIHVIDTYPVFRDFYVKYGRPLDRSPLDAHWNPAAHRLVAREVARIIEP